MYVYLQTVLLAEESVFFVVFFLGGGGGGDYNINTIIGWGGEGVWVCGGRGMVVQTLKLSSSTVGIRETLAEMAFY